MPMPHRCSFGGCDKRTLTTYCIEHEVLLRAKIHAERAQASIASDEPLTAEAAEMARNGLSAA